MRLRISTGFLGDSVPSTEKRKRPFSLPLAVIAPPPPPVPRNRIAQEPPAGSAVEFSHHFFFTRVLGFSWFWWMQDSYSGVQDNISCVLLWVPPSWGDPISQSQVHIPLKPLPPALDPFLEATSP